MPSRTSSPPTDPRYPQQMRRRTFLVGGGLAFGAGALSSCSPARPAAVNAAAVRGAPTTWADVKAEFNLAPDLAHMTGFFLASHPRVVRDALDAHRRALDADPVGYVDD